LSELQQKVFDTFDPRGDETLVALQARLAKEHLPKGNVPNSSDLSPLLAVFQEQGSEQRMSAYAPLWSELLSAMAYEAFEKTDLRERDKVHRLGRGIRDLLLRTDTEHSTLTLEEIGALCHYKVGESGDTTMAGPLKRVYFFHQSDGHNDNDGKEEDGVEAEKLAERA
jgi:hypothetical protein